MKFKYADPPYLGCCHMYDHFHNDGGGRPFDGKCWDEAQTHGHLVDWLVDNSDGFVMSLSSPSLADILPIMRIRLRIGAWVKPFASFKPGINPGYCWEPILFSGGRKLGRDSDTVRDFCSANITLIKGTPGAKPEGFCNWLMDLMGFDPAQDEFVDVFPGSGAFGRAVEKRANQGRLAL